VQPCPLCGNNSSKDFPIFYSLREKNFDSVKCKNCGFIFIVPRPNDSEIALMYSDEYFLFDGADFGAHSNTDYETAAVAGSVKFPLILARIRKYRPTGRFFEVGCGMGYFLNFVRENGYEVNGIEISELGAKSCREKFGLNVQKSSFEHYEGKPNSFDIIFFGDVVEHLNTPMEMLRKAYSLLAPNGIVAVEVPSQFNCLSGRIGPAVLSLLGRKKKMPMPPYHVNEFLPSTLRQMLAAARFSSIDITQRIKHPRTIALRGTIAEKIFKLGLQYPNTILTNTFGILGDRLLGIGVKE
jgi:2-polyprenyl-3-methyl-5-hydroxy-6-metoxy-1,4-benzoquinol methylase